MTAKQLLDDLVIDQTYQVIVRPNPGDSGRTFHWTISRYGPSRISDDHYARMVADGYTHPQDGAAWLTRAMITTPPITDDQAEAIALAWLTTVEGVAPAAMDCLLMLPDSNRRIFRP